MITAVHTLVYAQDADAARAFLRDVLQLPNVDAGDGWLIFRSGPSELAVHPTDAAGSGQHAISLMCDDIESTVTDLRERGVEFTREVRDDGFGLTTSFQVPGAGTMMLYQPRHPIAFGL